MCRPVQELRALPDEDAVVAGMVLRSIEAFKAVSRHMLAYAEALKDVRLGGDGGAAEPVDTVLDALEGAG